MERKAVRRYIVGTSRSVRGADKLISDAMLIEYGWGNHHEERKQHPGLKSHAWQALGLAVAARRGREAIEWL